MKLYKSQSGEVYAYELDGSQDHLIPSDFVALTQAEIDARVAADLAAQQATETAKASAVSKLTALGLTANEITALIG